MDNNDNNRHLTCVDYVALFCTIGIFILTVYGLSYIIGYLLMDKNAFFCEECIYIYPIIALKKFFICFFITVSTTFLLSLFSLCFFYMFYGLRRLTYLCVEHFKNNPFEHIYSL